MSICTEMLLQPSESLQLMPEKENIPQILNMLQAARESDSER